jgi:hypothetical protein
VAVLHAADPVRRTISECIALAKAHEEETGKAPVLDPDFAEDVEEILSHRKPWKPSTAKTIHASVLQFHSLEQFGSGLFAFHRATSQ